MKDQNKKRGLAHVRVGRGTASRTVGLLGAIFAYAVRHRMRRNNPVHGVIRPADPVDLAQQIWSTVHGAVALELGEMVLTDDPAVTYEHLLDLLTAGLTH